MNIIGTMFVETEGGVAEIAMVEAEDGSIYPGGVRDANHHGRPKVLPTPQQVREAIQLAKWCYLNQPVFEGKVSNISLAEWKNDEHPNSHQN